MPRIEDYEKYASQVRALRDTAARKAALLVLTHEIRSVVWTDSVLERAAQLGNLLMLEAVSIDADPLEPFGVCDAPPYSSSMTRSQALVLAARLAGSRCVASARLIVRRCVPPDGRIMAAIEAYRTPPTGNVRTPNTTKDR